MIDDNHKADQESAAEAARQAAEQDIQASATMHWGKTGKVDKVVVFEA